MESNWGIVGSGFGLYGYLPALMKLDRNVCTLLRYKERILSRDDIKHYLPELNLVDSYKDLIEFSDVIILAQRPVDQYLFCTENIQIYAEVIVRRPPFETSKEY